MTPTTEDMNRAIAEFEGYSQHPDSDYPDMCCIKNNYGSHDCVKWKSFKYHSDWNALMGVYNKCLLTIHDLLMSDRQPELITNAEFVSVRKGIWHVLASDKNTHIVEIAAVHAAVYAFVIWFKEKEGV